MSSQKNPQLNGTGYEEHVNQYISVVEVLIDEIVSNICKKKKKKKLRMDVWVVQRNNKPEAFVRIHIVLLRQLYIRNKTNSRIFGG